MRTITMTHVMFDIYHVSTLKEQSYLHLYQQVLFHLMQTQYKLNLFHVYSK